jgi:nucleoside-diphosphate-sugar epimerase
LDSSAVTKLGAEPFEADLTRASGLEQATSGMGTVFHLAGVIHPHSIRQLYDVNTRGTENLLKAAIQSGVRRFIYVSSNSVGGHTGSARQLMTEVDSPRPYLNYGKSKLLAEQAVLEAAKSGKIKAVILRPCWFYGEGQPVRQTRFFRMIKSGRPIILGDGKNLRSMTYIDNLVDALLLAEHRPHANGQVYWIADARPYPSIEIYQTVAELLGVRTLRPRFVPGLASDLCTFADTIFQAVGIYWMDVHVAGEMNKNIACSVEKAQRELGYDPKIDLREGMRRSIEWCRRRGMDI